MLRMVFGLMFAVAVATLGSSAWAGEAQVRFFYTGPVEITVTNDSPVVGLQGVAFFKGDTCIASPKGYDVVDGERDGRIILLYELEDLHVAVEGRDCAAYTTHEVPRAEVQLTDEQLKQELRKARDRHYGNGRCACDN